MALSKRISAVAPSATISITTKAKQMKADGKDVVSFAAGEPDFDTPQFIKDAAIEALAAGDTKYNPQKAPQLRQAIANKLATENGVTVTADEVVVTFGTKHALYAACQAMVDPGDKVLIPAPYWVSYPEMVNLAGGEPVAIDGLADNDYKITPQQLLDAAPGAKILILNSPSNPTGATYSPAELIELAKAVMKTDLIVFSDEIYEKLIYGDTKFVSLASLEAEVPGISKRVVTFNGVAKAFAMTGWRVGWVAGDKELIGGIKRLMSHETTNPVSFAQAGALAAYESDKAAPAIEAMRAEFEKRGIHMAARLNAIDGVTCSQPTGAFYCFPDVSSHYGKTVGGVEITDSLSFAKVALDQFEIAVIPGAPFGADRCVRLSFATSMEQIDKGLDRLEKMLG